MAKEMNKAAAGNLGYQPGFYKSGFTNLGLTNLGLTNLGLTNLGLTNLGLKNQSRSVTSGPACAARWP
ncbi:hypothetical protein CHH28_02755 [Bacterioplanes sanyensis]|uniref:Pentapeptide repeat-containing protein n=2 Tax=Bacterioplanes sanyensis TaxID=1249553 RepID=A0A222FGE2_9GAMM|nr:hypothetical protein CHH28_02755 [Bacterioplanes sanyensis]